MNKPVLIVSGGTGGHIFPAIAVAHVLKAHQIPVLWLGSEYGLENKLVRQAGFLFKAVKIRGLRGKNPLKVCMNSFLLIAAVWHAIKYIRQQAPRTVIAFGGFASGPGGLAAILTRTPLYVHEQNSAAGLTNKVLARFAKRVLLGFPNAFPTHPNCINTGNPVRAEIAMLPAPTPRSPSKPFHILILGGSQGARALNIAVPQALAHLSHQYAIQVLHQTGREPLPSITDTYAQHRVPAKIESFIDDMATAYSWADLVIGRSGASTIAELCAAGVGSILIPYPFAVDDHQTKNAQFLVTQQAAICIPENKELITQLTTTLDDLLTHHHRIYDMAKAAYDLAKPNAAKHIAEICAQEELI